jgi:hypothetical protein
VHARIGKSSDTDLEVGRPMSGMNDELAVKFEYRNDDSVSRGLGVTEEDNSLRYLIISF